MKLTIPNAKATGGTRKNTVNIGGQIQSGSVKAECDFQVITKDGVGRIERAFYDAKGSKVSGSFSYT